MDELDISGKRYISSKRAAKENRYHVDYIGQLIRAGKITGSKVGRTWYVEAESLDTYLGLDHMPDTTPIVPQNYVAPVVEKTIEPEPTEAPTRATPHTYALSETNSYTLRMSKIPVSVERPDPEYLKVSKGGLSYLSDDEPLQSPTARSEHKIEIHKQVVHPTASLDEVDHPAQVAISHFQAPKQPYKAPREGYSESTSKLLLYVAGFVGIIAFVGAIGVSYYLQFDTVVEAANVYSTVHF